MAKKSKPTKSKPKKKTSRRSFPELEKDVPVTQEMLFLVRDQLSYKISSYDKRFDSVDKKIESLDKRFDSVDKKIESLDKRFDSVDKKIESLDKKIDSVKFDLKSDIALVRADISRIALLVEEQNAKNKIVLDGLTTLFHRQDRHESESDKRINVLEDIILNKPSEP